MILTPPICRWHLSPFAGAGWQELLLPKTFLTCWRCELPQPAWAAQQRREDEDGLVHGEG